VSNSIVITADLHAHTFSSFSYVTEAGYNSRLAATMHTLRGILEACVEHKAPFIHLGDWFHSRRSVPVEAVHSSLEMFQEFTGVDKYFLVGNHDLLFNAGGSPYSIRMFER